MAQAADFDVRGCIPVVDPSALVYDIRQLTLGDSAQPETIATISAATMDSTDEGLVLNTMARMAPRSSAPQHVLNAIINAINDGDYETLERWAAIGYDFNFHAAAYNSTGVTPLNYVVREHPARVRYTAASIVMMLEWLVQHGANPHKRDFCFGWNMWQHIACGLKDDVCEHRMRVYRELHCAIQASPVLGKLMPPAASLDAYNAENPPTQAPPHVPDQTLLAIMDAIDRNDYVLLHWWASAGYDFNARRAGDVGQLCLAPLHYVVDQHPPNSSRSIESIVKMLIWLISHGADPNRREGIQNCTMWDMVSRNARGINPRSAKYAERFQMLEYVIFMSPFFDAIKRE